MRFNITFTILTFIVDLAWTENSAETKIDNTLKEFKRNSVPTLDVPQNIGPNLKALWTHNPIARLIPQSDRLDWSRPVPFRQPHSVTKLSKTFQKGFNPFFKKSDFEFEKRSKPITLVTIRKNGLAQRKALYKTSPESSSGEVAELQSPYNDVSTFWKDVVNA